MMALKPLKVRLKIQQLVSNLRRLRGANLYLRAALRALNGFYFNLKIDCYKRALTVQHYENKLKVGKISSFTNKKCQKTLLMQAGEIRALNSCSRRRAGGLFLVPSLVTLHLHQQNIHKLKVTKMC